MGQQDEQPPRRLTSAQVARHLHVSAATVQRYAREGRVPFLITPGGRRRFDLEEVRQALGPSDESI